MFILKKRKIAEWQDVNCNVYMYATSLNCCPPQPHVVPLPSVVFKNLTGENDNIEFHLLVLINSLRFTCNTSLGAHLGAKRVKGPWLLVVI